MKPGRVKPTPTILFLEALPTIAGGQSVLLNLLQGPLPFTPHVLLPGRGPLSHALEQRHIPYHPQPMQQYSLVHKTGRDRLAYALELPRLALATARLARRLNAQLLYANSSRAFLWGTLAALLSRRPILWHVHNILDDGGTLALVRQAGRLPHVRRLLCVCQAAQQQFPGLAHKSVVLYNGIDLTRLRPDPAGGQTTRASLHIPADHLVATLVGDLTPHKGQDILLAAAQQLPPGRGVTLLLVGQERPNDESRAFAAQLRATAAQLPAHCQALFTGQRHDMPQLYNASDVIVVAAFASETTSLALQEGMACGKPVIASRTGGIPELLHDGVNGFLYPPRDSQALAALLQKLRSDPAGAVPLAAQALTTAQQRFGLPQMRQQWLAQLSL